MPGVPVTTRIQLHIALVTSKISVALGECETSANGLTADPIPFVQVFESELGMIQDRYAGEWSPADEVSFLDARLSLYAYVLDQGNNQSPLESFRPVNELIAQSSITARQLLIVATTFPDILSKGIFHVFRSTSYAVFFLLRLLGTAQSQFIDEAAIKNIIRQTFALMKDMSETGSDRRFQCVRVCRIIENMIDYEDWNTNMPFTGKAKSFMANNFVADVAARGIIKANQRHSTVRAEHDCVTAGAPSEVDSGFGLDFSTWDSMEWAVNWQNIDDLLLSSEDTHGFS